MGAAVAQEEEQSPVNRKVGGSTPASLGYMSKRPWARHWTPRSSVYECVYEWLEST